MKKNDFIKHDEIDLFKLINTFWNEKIKIILIIFISVLVGVCYYLSSPQTYESSVIIKPSKNLQFTTIDNINTFLYLEESKKDKSEDSKNSNDLEKKMNIEILESFIEELNDNEELIIVLNNTEKKNQISNSSKDNQKQKIFNYAKSFSLNEVEGSNYLLKFKWDNKKESIKIIDEIIKLASINFKNRFFNKLQSRLELKKMHRLNQDTIRIALLKEQSIIAKKLGISVGEVKETSNLLEGYYLRGYEAINKEISMIQNRKYQDLDDIRNNINLLEKFDFKWVNYNSFLIEVNSTKNLQKTLTLSILIGLVIGLFYVFISDVLNPRKTKKIKSNSIKN